MSHRHNSMRVMMVPRPGIEPTHPLRDSGFGSKLTLSEKANTAISDRQPFHRLPPRITKYYAGGDSCPLCERLN